MPQLGMAADERADDLSYVASSARTGEQAYEDFWRQVSGTCMCVCMYVWMDGWMDDGQESRHTRTSGGR